MKEPTAVGRRDKTPEVDRALRSKEVDETFWESINERTHTDVMGIVIKLIEKRISAGKAMELIAERCEATRAAERARCVAAVEEARRLYGGRIRWEPILAAIRGEPDNPEDRNWPEDYAHENGNYSCKCVHCGQSFIGHKRRVTCKLCSRIRGNEGGGGEG